MPKRFDRSDVLKFIRSGESELPFVRSELISPDEKTVFYSDLNSGYRRNGKPVVVLDEDAIRGQINNILSTPLGSDHFEPTFGSLLPYRIFEPIGAQSAWLIKTDTITALTRWMGDRITINGPESYVVPLDNDPDNLGYDVYIEYAINRSRSASYYSVQVIR